MVCGLLVVDNNEDATLIAEFVLVSSFLNDPPSETSVSREEGITLVYPLANGRSMLQKPHHMAASIPRRIPRP